MLRFIIWKWRELLPQKYHVFMDVCKKFNDTSFSNGYNYEIALILSIFGGILGLDRFYLGYIALGWSILRLTLT